MHPWPAVIVYKGRYETFNRNNFSLKSVQESSYSQPSVSRTAEAPYVVGLIPRYSITAYNKKNARSDRSST